MHTIAEPKAEGFWPCDVGRRAAQEIDNCTYRSVVGCMMWGHLAGRLAAANASPAIVLSFVCLRGCVTAAAQGRASPPRESKERTTLWPLPRHLTRPARLRRGKAISNQSRWRQTAKSELTGAPQVVS